MLVNSSPVHYLQVRVETVFRERDLSVCSCALDALFRCNDASGRRGEAGECIEGELREFHVHLNFSLYPHSHYAPRFICFV